MKPLIPSPGSPKTVSTPQSMRRSTNRSEAVLAMRVPSLLVRVLGHGYPGPRRFASLQ
jgi:hypothetical protein